MRNINSLKKTSQFKEVYKKGRSVANELLVLYILKDGTVPSQFGISVSKKVGNSVIRHRVTRLIRESYLSNKDAVSDGIKIVVAARAAAADKKKKEIEEALLQLYKKQKIL